MISESEYKRVVLQRAGRKGGLRTQSERKHGAPARYPFKSKLEQAYNDYLLILVKTGEIQSYRYEPLTFNLAVKTRYTPDFEIMTKEGAREFHEVKGWMREDANIKLKVAARLNPDWKFILVRLRRGVWEQREVAA